MEYRVVRITEVNTEKGLIIGEDQYQQSVFISTGFNQPLIVVPQKDEFWMVIKEGMEWLLDRRADDTKTITNFNQLAPGDVRIEAKSDLKINANKFIFNGEEVNFPATLNVKVNDNNVGDIRTIHFKSNDDIVFNVALNASESEVDIYASGGNNVISYGTELPSVGNPGQPYWLTLKNMGYGVPYATGWIGAAGTTNAGTVSATLAHVTGDFLIAFVSGDSGISSSTTNTTTGWTKLFEIETSGEGSARLGCFYRFASASGSVITFTSTLATDTLCLAVAKYDCVSTVDPIHRFSTLSETSAGTSHTFDAPAHLLPKYTKVAGWAYDAAGATTLTATSEGEIVDTNQATTFHGVAMTNGPTNTVAAVTVPQTYSFTSTSSTSVTMAAGGLILAPPEITERVLLFYDDGLGKWISESKPYFTTIFGATGDKATGGAGVWNTEAVSTMFLPWDVYERHGLTYQFRLYGWSVSSPSETDLALICETSNLNLTSSIANVGAEFCRLVMSNATTSSVHASNWETIPTGFDLKDNLRVHLRWREETSATQNVVGYNIFYRLISK